MENNFNHPHNNFGFFRNQSEYFAIDTVFIQEVVPTQKLTPLMGESHFVLGSFWLRGQVIPVIDVSQMSGGGWAEDDGSFSAVVVVTFDKKAFGIAISEVISLAQSEGFNLSLYSGRVGQFSEGHCYDKEHSIDAIILDIKHLFSRGDIPFAAMESTLENKNRNGEKETLEVFLMRLDNVYVTIEAQQVHSCLTLKNITPPKVSCQHQVGEMVYIDSMVPIVDSRSLLLQSSTSTESVEDSPAFSVKMPNGGLVVFNVDEIQEIITIDKERFLELPDNDFVSKQWVESMVDISGQASYLATDQLALHINVEVLRQNALTQSMANLCRKVPTSSGAQRQITTDNKDSESETEVLLLFQHKGLFAIKLSDIIEIKMSTIPITSVPEPHIHGFFKFNAKIIALHTLENLFGASYPEGCEYYDNVAEHRILIAGDNNRQCAFKVDKLVDICDGRPISSSKDLNGNQSKFDNYLLERAGKKLYIKAISLDMLFHYCM